MPKRVCWRGKSNWSAEISMTLARLLRVSLCFTMIQLLLLALWTKLRWHIGKLAKPTKQIGSPGSCTKDSQITQAVRSTFLCVGDRASVVGGDFFRGPAECARSTKTVANAQPISVQLHL